MTLIIGIKCTNGIVLAADGAATMGSLGNSTVQQPTKKLKIIDNKVVVGVSGPVGLGQRITGEIQKMWSENAFSGSRLEEACKAMAEISEKIRDPIRKEFEMANNTKGLLGQEALRSVISNTLVAITISRKLHLFSFDHQGSPEEITCELPYASIGSGQQIADPFLGFLRRVYWRNNPPDVEQGSFAAVWALKHAIQVNPGGVADPMQIVTINAESNEARELGENDLSTTIEAIDTTESKLSDSFQEIASEENAVPIPTPPKEK